MNQHLAIKIRYFFVVKLRNSPPTAYATGLHALNHRILIVKMFDPDLVKDSLIL